MEPAAAILATGFGKEPTLLRKTDDTGDGGRRRFLKVGGLMTLGGLFALADPGAARAMATSLTRAASAASGRRLVLHNIHTGETERCVFADRRGYLPENLARFNHLLRDYRTGDVRAIDPKLLDLLYDLADELAVAPEYEIISGYRCPATNAMLRRHSKHVAKHSYHMLGQAADVRLRGVALPKLHRVALARRGGGVGFYPRSGFVHLDTGPVRSW